MKHIHGTYFQPFERIELIEPFELFLTRRQEVFVSRKARKVAKSAKGKILPTTNYKQQTTNILKYKERKVEYPNTKPQTTNQKQQTITTYFTNLFVIIIWLNLSITLIT